MAQMAPTPSGLEIDTRQDEFPSAYVTNLQDRYPTPHRQDEYPTAYNVNPPYPAQEAGPRGEDWDGRSVEKPAGQLKAEESRICGIRRLTFWLGLALGALIVVAAVGGGVLGSRMGKGSGLKSSQSSLSSSASSSSIVLSATSALSSSSSTSSSTTPTSTVVATLAKPANDCAAFGTPYTADVAAGKFQIKPSTNAVFDIYCKTDYVNGDFESFYAPSLLTCMNGCALFNYWQDFNGELAKKNCSGVTYGLGLQAYGNCYLKSGGFASTMTRDENSTYVRLRSTST